MSFPRKASIIAQPGRRPPAAGDARAWSKNQGQHAAALSLPLVRLAAVPVTLALIPADVPRVAINVSAVAVQVAIFAAQLGTLMRSGAVIAVIQIAAQLPAVMRDLGFVAANVA